jgi:hypothetical protein
MVLRFRLSAGREPARLQFATFEQGIMKDAFPVVGRCVTAPEP